ncbi:MAG: thioredoxin 1 [Nitrospinales bacterium]|jgi:thioredoxin 1
MKNTDIGSVTEVNDVGDEGFETLVMQSDKLALIDFWADWCQPCHMLAPTVQALAEDYAGQIFVGKVDIEANPITPHRYEIRSIPTLLLFKEGELMERLTGVRPKEEIESIIKVHL